jgi:phytanoyl-CoA hydroxylase
MGMLTPQQVQFYQDQGYLHIPEVFTRAETDELASELMWLIDTWAMKDAGWTGPWRKQYMDPETEKKSKLIALHDLQFYSAPWARAVINPRLVACMVDILGPNVELHHTTLHVKPPETGHPFPMHQDMAFYEHVDDRYVDVLVHLDDTRHENGEIRFLAGSHKFGYLKHVTQNEDGTPCSPHLPTDKYRLEDTVAVPAKRGDVVIFNVNTIHGSHVNVTNAMRRLVRVGYRHPENKQISGQSLKRPGLMVAGRRPGKPGMNAFSTEAA